MPGWRTQLRAPWERPADPDIKQYKQSGPSLETHSRARSIKAHWCQCPLAPEHWGWTRLVLASGEVVRAINGDSQLFAPLVRCKSHPRVERIALGDGNIILFSSALHAASEAETQWPIQKPPGNNMLSGRTVHKDTAVSPQGLESSKIKARRGARFHNDRNSNIGHANCDRPPWQLQIHGPPVLLFPEKLIVLLLCCAVFLM